MRRLASIFSSALLLTLCGCAHLLGAATPGAIAAQPPFAIAQADAASSLRISVLFTFDKQYNYTPKVVDFARNGMLYGTTSSTISSVGSVFQCSISGGCSTLVKFDYHQDGGPFAAPILARDGNLYGVTFDGGLGGVGTFYRVTLAGQLKILRTFNGSDATYALGIVEFSDGNFYGISDQGGANFRGNVFRLTPTGSATTLVSCDYSTCLHPNRLIMASGILYGSAQGDPGFGNNGEVFRLTSQFSRVRLATFNGTQEIGPGRLTQGTDGNFYGLTGGAGVGKPAFFRVSASGNRTIVATYNLPTPFSNLALGRDGNFYGTIFGDINNPGSVFRITPAGRLTTIAQFNLANGQHPEGVVVGPDGNLYGTTWAGGSTNGGVVFRVTLH